MGNGVLGDEGYENMEATDYDGYISEEEEEDISSFRMCLENSIQLYVDMEKKMGRTL